MNFSDLNSHHKDTGIAVFLVAVLSDCKEMDLERSNQEASPSAGKNVRVALVTCQTWKCVPMPTSGVWIFLRSLDVICYER